MLDHDKVFGNPSRYETDLMFKIVERADEIAEEINGEGIDRTSLLMDLEAVHHQIGLRLDELLKASRFDFMHDVFGIRRHMDRATGTLGGCFLPRYAMPENDAR